MVTQRKGISAMPLIDLHIPADLLSTSQQESLIQGLFQALLKCEHAANNPRAESINWLYVHEYPADKIYVAGKVRPKPHYRIEVTVMAGMLTEAVKKQVTEDMTRRVLETEGAKVNPMNAGRVWILFHDLPEGNWAAGGKLYRLQDLMRFIRGDNQ